LEFSLKAKDLLDTLQVGVVVHDASTQIIYANPQALELLRLTEQQALGKEALDPQWRFVDSDGKLMTIEQYPVTLVASTKQPIKNLEVGIIDGSDEKVTWVTCNAHPELSTDNEIEQIIVSFDDITHLKTGIPFDSLADSASDAIVITHASPISCEEDGPKIVYVNKKFTEMTGYLPKEVIGKTPRMLQGKDTDPKALTRISKSLAQQEPVTEHLINYNKAGEPYWVDVHIFPIRNALGKIVYFAALERDITADVEREQELVEMATQDSLTGILNRRGYLEHARTAIANCKRNGSPVSVAMIDMDYFKMINDSYGHAVGDAVLKVIATLLKASFRESDIIGRIGGEEFSVVLTNTDAKGAFELMEAFRKEVASSPYRFRQRTLVYTLSIGITTCSNHYFTLEESLEQADKALYRAKIEGRNRVCAFQRGKEG
jgi:diguanylate cyclase (GGDEF)-like protein/PAS domain S-box-containing protein